MESLKHNTLRGYVSMRNITLEDNETTFEFNGCKFTNSPDLAWTSTAAMYSTEQRMVHYQDQDELSLELFSLNMSLGYMLNPVEIILHEYVHYLQHKKGEFKKLVLLGVNAPITKAIKRNYPEEKWTIEAEAVWLQNKWHKFMTKEELVKLCDLLEQANI